MTPWHLGDAKKAAYTVLAQNLRPIRYPELARRVAPLLDIERQWTDAEVRALAEDIREKGLCSSAHPFGLAYIPAPLCFGVLRDWWSNRTLTNTDVVKIDTTNELSRRVGAETGLRFQYIQNKYGCLDLAHAEAISRGFLIEYAVSGWFRSMWPSLYREPDNAGHYQEWCGHDFKLDLPSIGMVTVDVAGPNRDGQWGRVQGKPKADLHIIADDPHALTIEIRGVVTSETFRHARFFADVAESITKLTVLLNCEVDRLDYFALGRTLGLSPKVGA